MQMKQPSYLHLLATVLKSDDRKFLRTKFGLAYINDENHGLVHF